MYENIKTPEQLERYPNSILLEIYNKATGKNTTKFASREKGIAQTLRALQAVNGNSSDEAPPELVKLLDLSGDQGEPAKKASRKKAPKPKGEPKQRGRKLGLSFRLEPHEEQRPCRSGSKREVVFNLVNREGGAKFSEVMKATGWNRKDAYEGTRLLNIHNGFGLWSNPVAGKDDYVIEIVTAAQFAKRAKVLGS